ncbi:MAG: tRNA pseudouridine(55) synthase TruB [Desulfonatronovibrionaceae bacterium]
MAAKGRQLHGVLVLSKPSGPTSTDCLNRLKRRFRPTKIGHAGTLDPLAEGVLPVLFGRATKLAPYITSGYKIYKGELLLGKSTDTYDIQGEITEENDISGITEEQVASEIDFWHTFTSQQVPAYSAAKHKGQPLYALKRRGQEVPEKTKEISIFRAKVLDMDLPRISFRVCCSPGTYIRSLAHSLGSRLGCGAVLTNLTRECSHPFTLDQSIGLDEIMDRDVNDHLIRLRDCLPDWSRFHLSSEAARLVGNGACLPVSATPGFLGSEGDKALLLGPDGRALAIVQAHKTDGQLRWAILRGLWT